MKLPNWQHHSKKEAKRTLKPQALRQAKKRRAALKKKLLAASVLLVGFASPAQAVTWREFWEPFQHSHHHHHHRPKRKCFDNVYTESWDDYGHKHYYYRKVRVPCWRKYHDPHDHHHH